MRYATCVGCAVAALLGVTPAAVTAQSRESRQMMADLRILQSQTQELQNAIAQLTQSTADALKAVNARLSEQTEAARKSMADQKVGIDAIGNDLRIVRERVDDNNVRVGTLAQEVDALRDVVTAAASNAPAPPAPDAAGAAPPDGTQPAPPSLAPTGSAAMGAAPQKMWDAAMSDFWGGQYDLAIMGFEQYEKAYPSSPRAGEALVKIGDSHYSSGTYARAIEAYDRAIRAYPNHAELPSAYYRKGEAQFSLKNPEAARQTWEFILKTYPNSLAALQAKQRLQALTP